MQGPRRGRDFLRSAGLQPAFDMTNEGHTTRTEDRIEEFFRPNRRRRVRARGLQDSDAS